jgi:hypothetical protein
VWRHVHGCARRRLLRDGVGDGRRIVLVARLPWWARGALRRRISAFVLLPDAPVPEAEPTVALPGRAGTLA